MLCRPWNSWLRSGGGPRQRPSFWTSAIACTSIGCGSWRIDCWVNRSLRFEWRRKVIVKGWPQTLKWPEPLQVFAGKVWEADSCSKDCRFPELGRQLLRQRWWDVRDVNWGTATLQGSLECCGGVPERGQAQPGEEWSMRESFSWILL